MAPDSPSEQIQIFSELPADHASFDISDPRVMAALSRAEELHFWHRSRNEFIASRLRMLGIGAGQRFLDLGCGAGCVSAHLSILGLSVVGVDGHRHLLLRAAQRAPKAKFWLHDLTRGVDELPPDRFDAVGLFDVLEHLDHPSQTLRQAADLVRSNGFVVGTVPAMMSLWSRADEQAGHVRRYETAELHRLLRSNQDCHVVEIVPFHRVLIPLWWMRKLMLARRRDGASVSTTNLRVPPWPINEWMLRLLRVERALSRGPSAWSQHGTSLWFALRKA
ncbi:MAG TPA: class I SAM-dependent methyltransferase [Polyangiaceae bacterium]|jgi:SAM-dependent methyltransferase|nr:MAG: Ubiquinone biosynthesis O-methyltransferase [Deltaproteobacteria bacterium ADurb.Bin207]HNS99122.1 class I SAM-dependent methyltransferase [Polyangiaceae bacterium]HNZ24195.1 class I SAM-dependent methyltransferase [Polyangiaceae bacterium]HOD22552.1 class I SAM-dependent methyltransferase [Polyangiaceae bacterium]HOE49452.1 class I SAM-dependent methyltransferase [Polyangiaceae bacterium]